MTRLGSTEPALESVGQAALTPLQRSADHRPLPVPRRMPAQSTNTGAAARYDWTLPADMTLGRQVSSGGPAVGGVTAPTADSSTLVSAQSTAPIVARSSPSPAGAPSSTSSEGILEIQTQAEEGAGGLAGEAETGGAGGPGGAMDERQMEDLLRRLYPKLRVQLARELLVARERAGLLTDLH
jgi:hypothetical protein